MWISVEQNRHWKEKGIGSGEKGAIQYWKWTNVGHCQLWFFHVHGQVSRLCSTNFLWFEATESPRRWNGGKRGSASILTSNTHRSKGVSYRSIYDILNLNRSHHHGIGMRGTCLIVTFLYLCLKCSLVVGGALRSLVCLLRRLPSAFRTDIQSFYSNWKILVSCNFWPHFQSLAFKTLNLLPFHRDKCQGLTWGSNKGIRFLI